MEWLVHARATDQDADAFNLNPRLLQHLISDPVTKPDVLPQYQEVDDHTLDVTTLSAGDSSYQEHYNDDHENDHPLLYLHSLTFKPALTQPHWTAQLGSSSESPQPNPSTGQARKHRLRAKAQLTAGYKESDGPAGGNALKGKRNRSSRQVDCNQRRARAKHHEHVISGGVEVLKSSEQILDAKELPFKETGWAGKPFNRAQGSILKKAWHSGTLGQLLTGFHRVTFSKE